MVLHKYTLFLVMTLVACVPSPSKIQAVATQKSSAQPTETIVPTLTPIPTATMTYRQALYPYTVMGLREHDYQSGEINVLGLIEETRDYKSYLIEYPSDGLIIRGVMQIPTRSEPPYPVIVMNHGWFSRTVYKSGDGTDRAAEYLNIRGYLTLAPDYRSWGTSTPGPSLFYSGFVIDVINLLRAIPSIPQADPSRVGLWGHSMGGAITIKVLTVIGGNDVLSKDNNLVKEEEGNTPTVRAAVLYSTVSADQVDVIERWGPGCYGDFIEGEINGNCNSSDILPLDLPAEVLNSYTSAVNDAAELSLFSPIKYIENVSVPVQIHYGTLDGKDLSGTPPEWSIKLLDVFLDFGKPVKLIAYEGQRHSFLNEAWYDFMNRVSKFYNLYVKNVD
jgi:dipeptidyl aminopeptidase/acylaminoacyl peptidase